MRIRQTLVPAATVGQSLWFFPVVLGLIMGLTGLVTIGLVLFSAIVLFQLVTLPVEFDASKRALQSLEANGLLAPDEIGGARAVLNAAALTYVAGFVASLGQLIYFFLLSRPLSYASATTATPAATSSAPAARAPRHRLVEHDEAQRGRDHDAALPHGGHRAGLGEPQRREDQQVGAAEQRAGDERAPAQLRLQRPAPAPARDQRHVDERGDREHDPQVGHRRRVLDPAGVDERVARDARPAGQRERDHPRIGRPAQTAHQQHPGRHQQHAAHLPGRGRRAEHARRSRPARAPAPNRGPADRRR